VKAALRDDRAPPSRAHQVWAMDFVHDQLAARPKLRILTVVDLFSRFSPVVDPRFRYRGEDVVATLDRVCAEVGYPASIRVDQDEGEPWPKAAQVARMNSFPATSICGRTTTT
jgi:putative transposase